MNYLLKNMLTDGALLCPIYRKEANRFLDRLDFHPHYELYFCHGAVPQKLVIGGEEHTLSQACALILPPFTVHHISLGEKREEFARYVVYFGKEFLSLFDPRILNRSLTESGTGILIPLSDAEADRLAGLLPPLYDGDGTEASRACALGLLLNDLSRLASRESSYVFEKTVSDVPKILEYIWQHVGEDLNADRLAARFNISRPKLDRDFRRFVGQSVHRTVIDCRISTALSLLRSSDRTVKEIAEICGFESEYYFYSFFKKNTGRTPSRWRQSATLPTDSL